MNTNSLNSEDVSLLEAVLEDFIKNKYSEIPNDIKTKFNSVAINLIAKLNKLDLKFTLTDCQVIVIALNEFIFTIENSGIPKDKQTKKYLKLSTKLINFFEKFLPEY